jgi:hypothetical protein
MIYDCSMRTAELQGYETQVNPEIFNTSEGSQYLARCTNLLKEITV